MRLLRSYLAAALLLANTVPAFAEELPVVFSPQLQIPDAELDAIRGEAGWSLTRNNLFAIADAQSRTDTTFMNGVSQIEMDVLWSTQGSEWIANSVRATLP